MTTFSKICLPRLTQVQTCALESISSESWFALAIVASNFVWTVSIYITTLLSIALIYIWNREAFLLPLYLNQCCTLKSCFCVHWFDTLHLHFSLHIQFKQVKTQQTCAYQSISIEAIIALTSVGTNCVCAFSIWTASVPIYTFIVIWKKIINNLKLTYLQGTNATTFCKSSKTGQTCALKTISTETWFAVTSVGTICVCTVSICTATVSRWTLIFVWKNKKDKFQLSASRLWAWRYTFANRNPK